MLTVERVGPVRLLISCGDVATAELIEALCMLWPSGPKELTTEVGNLTEYNAVRAKLQQQADAYQEEINAVDIGTDPDARSKIDAAVAKRDAIRRVLRATMVDTNPQPQDS